ncbi:MAG: hypothetical protein FJ125_15705 [Deltaproteobacteria bacterium]|nr:hypothetical protein [Deltaproteobacteria bacterium]
MTTMLERMYIHGEWVAAADGCNRSVGVQLPKKTTDFRLQAPGAEIGSSPNYADSLEVLFFAPEA